MTVAIIGVDCATEAKKVGLAYAQCDRGIMSVISTETAASHDELINILQQWLAQHTGTLLAMDAPLGWPAALGAELSCHQAGQSIQAQPNRLFRRETDRFVKEKTGRQSLDVGADRIARTATAALTLIDELRQRTGLPLPMAWEPSAPTTAAVIEVYPAATLSVLGLSSRGYKGHRSEQLKVREALVQGLDEHIDIADKAPLLEDDNVLDAVICALAGADFLQERSWPPANRQCALKEGWIWVRRPC